MGPIGGDKAILTLQIMILDEDTRQNCLMTHGKLCPFITIGNSNICTAQCNLQNKHKEYYQIMILPMQHTTKTLEISKIDIL